MSNKPIETKLAESDAKLDGFLMKPHFTGATYDLTQENMNHLIRQLEVFKFENREMFEIALKMRTVLEDYRWGSDEHDQWNNEDVIEVSHEFDEFLKRKL